VFHVSRDSETYCNRFGVRPVIAGDMSIITLDGEEHVNKRRLINKGFTPRRVREMIPHVRELANEIIDEMLTKGNPDFVEDFAIHVPLIIIAELMGLDPAQRLKMYGWSDAMMAGDGRDQPDDPVLHAAAIAFGEYVEMCIGLIAERRANPQDDIISVLTKAADEGELARGVPSNHTEIGMNAKATEALELEQFEDDDLLAFLAVLLVAGNETTRNAISGGMMALSQFPEQKAYLIDHLDDDAAMDLAVDELVRFVTPVMGFIRTVTRDHTYANTDLKEGDRILMLYGSANRDATVIPNPDQLDLTRNPNPHLAFGIGQHYCLGANLARMEVKTVFQELLRRLPDIHIPESVRPSRGDSTLVLALQHMNVDLGAECPVGATSQPTSQNAAGCPV
jgi:cytochrome P450 family 142 subfamily A polypeptide 1